MSIATKKTTILEGIRSDEVNVKSELWKII